jgi:hypothetical protein
VSLRGHALALCHLDRWFGATFTLVNNTSSYLHAVINTIPTVYLAPGGVVNDDAGGLGNVSVEVHYSPGPAGQGERHPVV